MGKILSLVLGLSVLGFLAYRTMYGRQPVGGDEAQGTPKERLENVREAARNIEAKDDARLKEIEQRTTGD